MEMRGAQGNVLMVAIDDAFGDLLGFFPGFGVLGVQSRLIASRKIDCVHRRPDKHYPTPILRGSLSPSQ